MIVQQHLMCTHHMLHSDGNSWQFLVDFALSYTAAWFEGKPWLRGEAAGEA